LGGFLASLAWVMLMFLAFNKQAFANYYFFVVGTFCLAIAVWNRDAIPTDNPGPVGDNAA
jgi:hypothetical protein